MHLEYYNQHTSNGSRQDTSDVMHLLYSMNRSKQNNALLTEYFLNEFALDPEKFISVVRKIKSELADLENPRRKRLARRYLYVFSFLCERFGLYEDKLELDDLCFSITDPEEYKKLSKQLEIYQKKSEKIIEKIRNIFATKLQQQ